MDADRFDALTRVLATRPSRRGVLRSLAGGLTAGLLSHPALADETCKAAGKACSKASQCCAGLCAPPPTGHTSVAASDSVCCAAGQVIDPSGACCTPSCTGTCDGASDGCGGPCPGACGPDQVCLNGTCCGTGGFVCNGNGALCCTGTCGGDGHCPTLSAA